MEEVSKKRETKTFEFNIKLLISNKKDNESGSENQAYSIKKDFSRYVSEYWQIPALERNMNKENYYANAPERFINYVFNKHFRFNGNWKAYLTNYKEQEGSLLITFTVIAITTFSNYGGIRETIDYFTEDLEKLCEMTMGHKYDIKVENKEKKKSFDNNGNLKSISKNIDENSIQGLNKKITWFKTAFGVSIFLILFILVFINLPKNSDTDDTEKLIEKKLEELDRNKKIEQLINSKTDKYQIGDTVIIGIIK